MSSSSVIPSMTMDAKVEKDEDSYPISIKVPDDLTRDQLRAATRALSPEAEAEAIALLTNSFPRNKHIRLCLRPAPLSCETNPFVARMFLRFTTAGEPRVQCTYAIALAMPTLRTVMRVTGARMAQFAASLVNSSVSCFWGARPHGHQVARRRVVTVG